MSSPLADSGNILLARMGADAAERIAPHLEPVEMPKRFVLDKGDTSIPHVYFPTDGVASTVARDAQGRWAEVGLFGREGMSGHPVILGNDRSPYDSFMQVGGHGLRIESDVLRDLVAEDEALRTLLTRYVQAYIVQTSHTAMANVHARIEERLARWLLMCDDRIGTGELPLTHEFMSYMLGFGARA